MTQIEAPKPGIYEGIPFDQYQRWDAINPSLAKSARVSLKQFYHDREAGSKPPTPAMRIGTAEHCTVLEPDEFPRRYVVWTGGRRAGKAFEQFEIANADKMVLTESEYSRLIAMRKAAHSHPLAGPILTDSKAQREISIVWRDNATGMLCKGRMDLLSDTIDDLKTCERLTERRIALACSEYGYHISMAAYEHGIWTLTGERKRTRLVFVCSQAPHDCAVVPVEDESLECGLSKWRRLLKNIKEATESGVWPGLAEDRELPLILPAYELEANGNLNLTLNGMEIEP